MTPEEKLKELGIELSEAPTPLGSYLPVTKTGTLVYLSGILPIVEGKLLRHGRVGEHITVEEAREDAKRAVLNALSVLRSSIGSLNAVKQCIKITGYIASSPDFTEQPKVLNAASDLLYEIFGEAGKHARAAVGVSVLPLNAPIEIDFIFEVS
jgi:enamine deaminase RidA (YjgF/YER057c/UK114 family)